MICTFRKENKEAFEQAFTKILVLGVQTEKQKKIGGISVGGCKVKANASKHKAVSYKRAGEIIQEMEAEVQELVRLAENNHTLMTKNIV